MSKQILPQELAAIVSGLLIKPDVFGELDSQEKHEQFFFDIGKVVADYCGGHVSSVNAGDTTAPDLPFAGSSPLLSVHPDPSLPSLNRNVWSYYDLDESWEEESFEGYGIEVGEPLTEEEVQNVHDMLRSLHGNVTLSEGQTSYRFFEMQDWKVRENLGTAYAGDEMPYQVTSRIGATTELEFEREGADFHIRLAAEINSGVPAFHFHLGGDDEAVLHIHAAHGGLVLTPAASDTEVTPAEPDRYAYNDPKSLLIR